MASSPWLEETIKDFPESEAKEDFRQCVADGASDGVDEDFAAFQCEHLLKVDPTSPIVFKNLVRQEVNKKSLL